MDEQTEITKKVTTVTQIMDERIFELLSSLENDVLDYYVRNVKCPVSINLAICNWDDLTEFLKKRLQYERK